MKKNIKVYTDGACNGTPGAGGWACIIRIPGEDEVELSGGLNLTTNNRMEIMAVLESLNYLEGRKEPIEIYSDSQYVVKSVNHWLAGWMRKKDPTKKNMDLWVKVWQHKLNNPNIQANWVKGHNGHIENERCDELADIAMNEPNLPIDHVCSRNYSEKQITLPPIVIIEGVRFIKQTDGEITVYHMIKED